MKNNIKEARKDAGLTQKELGERIGVKDSTISQYEAGKRQPDNTTLLMLAEELNTTVGYLLGIEGKPGIKEAPSNSDEATEDAIKAAFWGGEKELSQNEIDELWEDAKSYIAFKTEQMRKKRRK